MQKRHYADLGNKLGFPVDYEENDQEMNGIFSTKSDYLRILQLAKLRNISFEKQYDLKEHTQDVEFDKLRILANELEHYKKEHNLIDYNDMIVEFDGLIMEVKNSSLELAQASKNLKTSSGVLRLLKISY